MRQTLLQHPDFGVEQKKEQPTSVFLLECLPCAANVLGNVDGVIRVLLNPRHGGNFQVLFRCRKSTMDIITPAICIVAMQGSYTT